MLHCIFDSLNFTLILANVILSKYFDLNDHCCKDKRIFLSFISNTFLKVSQTHELIRIIKTFNIL